jgi:hypothetical protein
VPRLVALVATVWYAVALSWGLFARIGPGHWAVVASRGIIAENMAAWHILGPVREYTLAPPAPSQYYVHHPWGTFWLIGLAARLLGRHPYVPRLVAIALSTATPPMLYGIARALWGPAAGAVAAVAYVVLPITLAFGNFPGFEGPLIFGIVLTTWGYVRFAQRWRRRWMFVSLAGVLWSVNVDWVSAIFLGVVLGAFMVAHFVFPSRWFGRAPVRRFGQWWAMAAILSAATVLAYLLYFYAIDATGELLQSEGRRSRGHEMPLASVLQARHAWIDATFTPLAVTIGKVAAPLFVARVLLLRRVLEVFPLAMLAMATGHYVWFKQAADIHIYWPFPFAPYFALSAAALATSAAGLLRKVASVLRPLSPARVEGAVAGLFGVALLSMLPDAVASLRYARETGGRFNDKGHLNLREGDKAQALEWMSARMATDTVVELHPEMHPTWAQDWALHRPTVANPKGSRPRYFVGDLAFMTGAEQKRFADSFHVTAVGRYVLVDREAGPGPADVLVFDEREPNLLERYLSYDVDPVRTLRPDPWAAWELRAHWAQTPNPPPTTAPSSLEQLRIAHNLALAESDLGVAQALEAKVLGSLDTSVATDFPDGTRLLGKRYAPGVTPRLDLYFRAGGPAGIDAPFRIDSIMRRGRPFSLVPNDETVKEVETPFAIPMTLWKPGFIYVESSELAGRPGLEELEGHFVGAYGAPGPPQLGGASRFLLLRREN